MEAHQLPRWAQEVEAILKKQYGGAELTQRLEATYGLIDLALKVEEPSGDDGEAVALLLKLASLELDGVAATYAGFMLGVAWEQHRGG